MKKALGFLCLVSLFISCSKEEKTQTPNVIIIYADDLGYGDVSAYESGTLHTPNIDRLAAGGIKFTQAYATSATCTPSRFSLLTGIYPWRNERARVLAGDAPLLIHPDTTTIADIFSSAGYSTAVIGKWHLGFDYSYIMAATNDRVPTVYVKNKMVENLSPDDPLYVNYQENFEGEPTAISNPELMTKIKWQHGHNMSVHNGIPRIGFMKGGKSALWTDETMYEIFLNEVYSFIDANRQKPFFLYYGLHEPHVPRVPNEKFVGKSGMGPRGDAILEADYCVGQLLDKLGKDGLLENTLIIFSSDNGPVLNDGYYDDAVEKLGDHTPRGPLRGGKYSLFEAGTRVPFITYWKGKINPGTSDEMISQLDIAASMKSLISSGESHYDGQNFLNMLLGKEQKGREELVIQAMGRTALRWKNWAYLPANQGPAVVQHVNNETGFSMEEQLYDLSRDLGQNQNLAETESEMLEKLRNRYLELTKR
ncbi:sulfatase-like hydrolase/transferase [Jiulongibacter sediminis]|uniref:Arylsulfatase n=1 Tax=Jiulongibacter sediminis TaxID=1605367 RepID=A0A0P7BSQ5_9BACT|nr:sulfatase-like hydrolase/transferase [Jiulongibacter sediminis]KPM47969.1 arylsulfatase [Jiulongibacter sediminis]TBX24151.1 arylsulfatase [Jiulongibacter sediminis]